MRTQAKPVCTPEYAPDIRPICPVHAPDKPVCTAEHAPDKYTVSNHLSGVYIYNMYKIQSTSMTENTVQHLEAKFRAHCLTINSYVPVRAKFKCSKKMVFRLHIFYLNNIQHL